MKASEIIKQIQDSFANVSLKKTYGETTFFYNPDHRFANGSYFCTIKEADGPNDKASQLNRSDYYRLSFKPNPETFKKFFGDKPIRPSKGSHIITSFDLAKPNEWMPHAIYGWMGWTMILSPDASTMEKLWPYLHDAYLVAQQNYFFKLNKMR